MVRIREDNFLVTVATFNAVDVPLGVRKCGSSQIAHERLESHGCFASWPLKCHGSEKRSESSLVCWSVVRDAKDWEGEGRAMLV
jgi:hypothetical protein